MENLKKLLNKISAEVEAVAAKHPEPFYANIGVKAFQDGNGEQWINEVAEQAETNPERTERALSFTLVFLIKKYKANGKVSI